AGHQRHAGHVATSPKLIFRNVFVADADSPLDVVEDNRRELLHFEALGIVAADFFDVRDHVIEVVLGEIDDQILALHRTLAEAFARWLGFNRMAAVLTRPAAGGTAAVIGLLYF